MTAEPDVALDRAACSIHTDRQAVARCAQCGRPACLACAVPFRGEVLCAGCAARALGEERPPEVLRPVRDRRPDIPAAALLLAALAVTIPPWHLFGPLDRPLAAWNPSLDPWPTVAAALLVGALAVALAPAALGLPTVRAQAVLYCALAVMAGLTLVAWVLNAPPYVEHTAAPYLQLGLLALAAAVAVVRLSRWRRPAGG